jgi:hypothetical protein
LEAALALAVLSSRHQAVACALVVFRASWLRPATQAKCTAVVGPVQFGRGLTLPSRGCPKGCAFCAPLMSNVRPRLKVSANQPVQRFCSSAFAKSSAPKKNLLVFARFGGRAHKWLRRQRLGMRPSASWCPATRRAPRAAHFWSHAHSPLAAVNRGFSSHQSNSCFGGPQLSASSGGVRALYPSSLLASAGNPSKMHSGSWASAIRARPNPLQGLLS